MENKRTSNVEVINTIDASAWTLGLNLALISDHIFKGKVSCGPIRKKVIIVSSKESTKASKLPVISAVLILGRVI